MSLRLLGAVTRHVARSHAVPRASLMASRWNTTQALPPKVGMAAKIYPLEKNTITEQDVDQWLKAVETLKKGERAETAEEVYLQQLTDPEQFLQEKFEPSEQQLAEVERYANKRLPLINDPVVDHFTQLIMRNGKKARAQIQMSQALYFVYLKTRRDPVKILYETLDKLGPLFHTKIMKTGTAKNRVVPFPLDQKQRNRYAMLWIIEGSKKKKSYDLSVRLGDEIIAVWEGKSSGFEKKNQLHKAALANRANIVL